MTAKMPTASTTCVDIYRMNSSDLITAFAISRAALAIRRTYAHETAREGPSGRERRAGPARVAASRYGLDLGTKVVVVAYKAVDAEGGR